MLWTRLIQFRQTSILLGQEFALDLYGDYEAKIKMLFKGQSPTTRHVSRIQKVVPDLLFVRA